MLIMQGISIIQMQYTDISLQVDLERGEKNLMSFFSPDLSVVQLTMIIELSGVPFGMR